MQRSNYLFTSESVSEGHPDKVCDQISDAILDAFLENDLKLGIADDSKVNTRLGCETLCTTNKIVIAGEGRGQAPLFRKHGDKAVVDREMITEIARGVVKDIGYDQDGFSYYGADVEVLLHGQSPDIAMGVDAKKKKGSEEEGAGDQGMMFGYACTESEVYEKGSFMPAPIYFAHKILKVLSEKRRSGALFDLQPDAKSQVTVKYVDGKPVGCTKVVVSTQHNAQTRNGKKYSPGMVKEMIGDFGRKALPEGWMPKKPSDFLVNPTGNFVIGGPDGDCGLTGRKIIVDTYGGYAPHGGGAFSGKDPTKVDRSAAYAARYLAKNVVAAGPGAELHHPDRLRDRRCRSDVGLCGYPRHRPGGRSQAAEDPAGTVSAAADQHPPRAEAQPADLSPHRGLRPFRPRAGKGRRLLLGADRPRRRAQAQLALEPAIAASRGVKPNEAVDRNDPPPLALCCPRTHIASEPKRRTRVAERRSENNEGDFFFGCALALGMAVTASPADAKGCIKGALVGGVAGHYAGHHGLLGAAAGCVVGHHLAEARGRRKMPRPNSCTKAESPLKTRCRTLFVSGRMRA